MFSLSKKSSSIMIENEVDCAVFGGVPAIAHEEGSKTSHDGRFSVVALGTSLMAAGWPSIMTLPTSPV